MRILFLVYHGFSEHSGISKKIHYQVKGLRENGHDVRLCYYGFAENGHRCRYIGETVIKDYGMGAWAGLRQRMDYTPIYDYCVREGIEFVYARCFQNASPWLIRFFRKLRKAGIRAVTEIPTYPYDHEFDTFGWKQRLALKVDQLFRRRLSREMEAIVTFSDAKEIFGQRTINISNGVDFDSIPLHSPGDGRHAGKRDPLPGPLHLIGVAEVHIWHAYDRMIAGLGEYYRQGGRRDVVFHIVGGVHPHERYRANAFHPGLQAIIDRYGIQDKVVFHGQLFGSALDEVFNQCQFAIGSLGRHRSGITVIKTLKNREYATRGLPFIYSEQDSDFDNQPYVLKAPADESPIDVKRILHFMDGFSQKPEEIRKTVEHLTWKIQMQKVIEARVKSLTNMKIAYIYSELTIKGGADKIITEKANWLSRHGYDVVIVTESQMGRETAFPLEPAVRHIDLGLDFNEQYRHGSARRLWIYLCLMRKYKKLLADVLKKEKADIVITTMGRSIGIVNSVDDGSVKIGEAHNKKEKLRSLHILEQRGGVYKYVAKYMRWMMERNAARLKALVVLTEQHANDWKGIVKTLVIPNPIPSKPKGVAQLDNKQVIMVGRYNEAKGYDFLIPAWEMVHSRHPDWTLHVYGSGEMKEQVARWVDESHTEGTIVLHEPVANIMDKYQESSICVLSSRFEGFPLVILEAMACGVPVVSFNCPHGPSTIIRDGEDGLLIDYLNTQALADGLCRLIGDEALRKRLGANARTNIQRFSEEKVMGRWQQLFEQLAR